MKSGNGRGMNRREFVLGAAGLGAGASLFPGALLGSDPSPWVASIEARSDRFKILAVADLHFFNGPIHSFKDPLTVRALGRMVETFEADLLVVCGDMWHNNPMGQGLRYCRWSCKKISGLGVPWAFAWGNHDLSDDFNQCCRMLEESPHSLFRGGSTNGNYRIEVTRPGQGCRWNLFVVNDAVPEMGMRMNQAEWVASECRLIEADVPSPAPAIIFCHIPLVQYDDIVSRGLARGIMHEEICHEDGSAEAFSMIRDTGMIKAVYCGHDHVNDYFGELDGVRLEYVRSSGYSGYGNLKVKKGGTLITADLGAGTFESVSVFPGGKTWTLEGVVEQG